VPYFGDKALDAYKENDVQTWVAVLEADGLTNKTIQNYVGLVSSLFRYAVRKKLARENPCDGVELPVRVSNGKIRFLDPVEVEALVRCAVPGSYEAIDRALYMTAAMTGLRQGELLALRWRDVDWTAGRVRVEQSYVLGKFDTPKSGKVRSVPLADTLGGELDRLHKASSFDGDEDLVFADPDTGLPMMRGCLMRRYRRALNAAHVDPTHRFHDLRHTFGTRMAKARVPIRTLQEWMGHADMKTTLIYVGYAPSEHEVAQVNAAFAVEALQPTPTQEIVNNGSHKGDSSGGSFPPRGS
jgi:integrase